MTSELTLTGKLERYFFTIQSGNHPHREDRNGTELPGHEAAWQYAASLCREGLGEMRAGCDHEWRVDVQTEDHEPLFSMRFIAEKYWT
jgi:hypothetical protein